MIGGVQYRKTTGMTDLQMAKRKASEFDQQIRSGNAGWRGQAPTVAEWIDRYLARLHGKQLERDTSLLRWIKAAWGAERIDTIKRSDAEAYLAKRIHEAKSATGTIWLEAVRIKHVFNLAIHDDILTKNPWAQVRLPKPPQRSRVLSTDEERKIRAGLDPDSWLARLFTVVLGTGLRRKELLGLRPRDIIDGVIKVPEALAKGGKARSVPLRKDVREALRAQVAFEEQNAPQGAWTPVAGMENIRFFSLSAFHVTESVGKAAEAAGLPGLTLHDLRRTFATRCATGELTGMSIPLLHLTRIMGHSNPSITARYYVYLNDAELIRQMKDQIQQPLEDASLKEDLLEPGVAPEEHPLQGAEKPKAEYPPETE